ncbi:MAG: transposase [Myxococcales bacterium]|nr:transposase [Myxococcales bacterium]
MQRFSKTLSCYPHLHVLVLDGAYVETEDDGLDFVDDPGPLPVDVEALEDKVLVRFERWLCRHEYLDDAPKGPKEDDIWWLAAAQAPSGAITLVEDKKRRRPGFEVHAQVRVRKGDVVGRQQLVRYVTRPPFAEDQLEMLDEERVRLELRSPSRSGRSQIILHPLALLRRLTWLLSPPRQHQICYAGVLAPAAALRPAVVPAGRISVQGTLFRTDRAFEPLTPEPYRVGWAQLLARVYDVDGRVPRVPREARPSGRGPASTRRDLGRHRPHLPRRRDASTDGAAVAGLPRGELTVADPRQTCRPQASARATSTLVFVPSSSRRSSQFDPQLAESRRR